MYSANLKPFYEELKLIYRVKKSLFFSFLMLQQIMLSRRAEPERLKYVVAKSSFHMSFFRSLVSVFPRAKFVVLHRAPKVSFSGVWCFCFVQLLHRLLVDRFALFCGR